MQQSGIGGRSYPVSSCSRPFTAETLSMSGIVSETACPLSFQSLFSAMTGHTTWNVTGDGLCCAKMLSGIKWSSPRGLKRGKGGMGQQRNADSREISAVIPKGGLPCKNMGT